MNPEAPVSDPAVGDGEATPASEDRIIRIDPDNLYGDFARALERPEFAQAAKTVIGTRAKREADARIRELEAELESMTLTQQRRRFESMDADERAEALADPNVAAEYAEVMRKKAADPQVIRNQNAVNNAVEAALDELRSIGAPEARMQVWDAYLRDPNAPFDRSSAAAFVRSVQRAVDMEIHTPESERFTKYGYGKAPAPSKEEEGQPETPVLAANPRLARGAPDTSRPDGGGKKQRFSTQQEASALLMNGEITIEQMRWAKRNLPYS